MSYASGWDAAELRAAVADHVEQSEPNALPTGVVPPPTTPLVIVDHFDLSMVDAPTLGAILRVRALTKMDARDLIAAQPSTPAVVMFERATQDIERDLCLPSGPRARVAQGTAVLVRTRLAWNDVRWHLVSYERDA
jgi:hypothetical protein